MVRHGEIGDAFFDYDAAQFLLGQLDRRCEAPTQHAAEEPAEEKSSISENGACSNGPRLQPVHSATERAPGAGTCAGEAHDGERRASHGDAGPSNVGNGACDEPVTARYGHAVGPRWVQALPGQGAHGRLTLERGCHVARVVRALIVLCSAVGVPVVGMRQTPRRGSVWCATAEQGAPFLTNKQKCLSRHSSVSAHMHVHTQ